MVKFTSTHPHLHVAGDGRQWTISKQMRSKQRRSNEEEEAILITTLLMNPTPPPVPGDGTATSTDNETNYNSEGVNPITALLTMFEALRSLRDAVAPELGYIHETAHVNAILIIILILLLTCCNEIVANCLSKNTLLRH
jgi:hypothetical protein